MGQDTYTIEKYNPMNGRRIPCRVFLNFYGLGKDGYRFAGDSSMYSAEELDAMTPKSVYPSG